MNAYVVFETEKAAQDATERLVIINYMIMLPLWPNDTS